MRAVPLAIVLLLFAPTASAILLPDFFVRLDLDVPPYARAGAPVTYTAWAGTNTPVVSSGVPGQNVTLYEDGIAVAFGVTDLDGIARFTRTYPARGAHSIAARLWWGNPASDLVIPAFADPRTILIGGPPQAPASLVVSRGPFWDEATLAWAPPADDGGVPVGSYWHEMFAATGIVDASTRSLIRLGVEPGQTYTARVRAQNGLGVGPWREASFTAPTPPPRDSIAPEVTGFYLCDGLTDCRTVAPGSTTHVQYEARPFRVIASGVLVDEGIGVADELIHARATTRSPGPSTSNHRMATLADGSFPFETPEIRIDGTNECRLVSVDLEARYPGIVGTSSASITICFA